MAIDVAWTTGVISVPRAGMPVVQASPEVRELDVDWFRGQLKDLEASEQGMPYTDTHRHEPESTISGDPYVRKVIFLAPYTIEFEDGQYAVKCTGANHNIYDRRVMNQVSLIIGNSAGLVRDPAADQASVEAGLSAQGYSAARASKLDCLDADVSTRAVAGAAMALTSEERTTLAGVVMEQEVGNPWTVNNILDLLRKLATNRLEEACGDPGTLVLYDDDNVTPFYTWQLRDEDGKETKKIVGAPARRSVGS